MKWMLGVSIIAVAMGWFAIATIPAATTSIDAVSLKFLPPETQSIAFIDVAGLRNAPLIQDALKAHDAALSGRVAEFVTATGVDPRRDVDMVTFAKTGERDGFIIVQGRFDRFKLEQHLKDKGKEPEIYLGQALYRDGDGAFVILDNVVLLGQVNAVKKAVDQMQLPGSPPLRADLMAAIQTIEAGNQVWAVGDFSVNDLGTVGVRGPAPVLEMLKSLQGGVYQMRVDTGVSARATARFADAESAKNFGDLARGAIAVAKLQVAQRQPDVLHLLDGIQISYSGPTLTVNIDEPGELLKKLQSLGPTIQRKLQ
jgi:hypothetical protein